MDGRRGADSRDCSLCIGSSSEQLNSDRELVSQRNSSLTLSYGFRDNCSMGLVC